MDKKTGKYLYCSKCKEYPDNVVSEEMVNVRRTWDGDCYQGENTDYSGQDEKFFCQECDTELEDKYDYKKKK